MTRQAGWRLFVKRAVDRSAAAIGLVAAAPVMAVAAVAVRATMGSPVLFRQQRPGRYGQPFTLYKLRTMRNAHDASGKPLPDGQRMTKLGQFLRSTSLDELPQLVNVLRGDLSIVGPRPLLMEYLARYSTEQARRHEVLPGITSWTAINGRNNLSWPEKFALDVWYVDHWSLALDARIILKTVSLVLGRKGVSRDGFATTQEFRGER
ncbi:MAG TPA: sugar transferase [Kofleriaceae bacterium]|jgi:lipopolysaccharide/colanic/teichoic acid biosynthesis glycosyltransferase